MLIDRSMQLSGPMNDSHIAALLELARKRQQEPIDLADDSKARARMMGTLVGRTLINTKLTPHYIRLILSRCADTAPRQEKSRWGNGERRQRSLRPRLRKRQTA